MNVRRLLWWWLLAIHACQTLPQLPQQKLFPALRTCPFRADIPLLSLADIRQNLPVEKLFDTFFAPIAHVTFRHQTTTQYFDVNPEAPRSPLHAHFFAYLGPAIPDDVYLSIAFVDMRLDAQVTRVLKMPANPRPRRMMYLNSTHMISPATLFFFVEKCDAQRDLMVHWTGRTAASSYLHTISLVCEWHHDDVVTHRHCRPLERSFGVMRQDTALGMIRNRQRRTPWADQRCHHDFSYSRKTGTFLTLCNYEMSEPREYDLGGNLRWRMRSPLKNSSHFNSIFWDSEHNLFVVNDIQSNQVFVVKKETREVLYADEIGAFHDVQMLDQRDQRSYIAFLNHRTNPGNLPLF